MAVSYPHENSCLPHASWPPRPPWDPPGVALTPHDDCCAGVGGGRQRHGQPNDSAEPGSQRHADLSRPPRPFYGVPPIPSYQGEGA